MVDALFAAVNRSDLPATAHCLASGRTDVCAATDANGNTLLHLAAVKNSVRLGSLLLVYAAQTEPAERLHYWVNQPNAEGFSALHFACFNGNLVRRHTAACESPCAQWGPARLRH